MFLLSCFFLWTQRHKTFPICRPISFNYSQNLKSVNLCWWALLLCQKTPSHLTGMVYCIYRKSLVFLSSSHEKLEQQQRCCVYILLSIEALVSKKKKYPANKIKSDFEFEQNNNHKLSHNSGKWAKCNKIKQHTLI